MTFFGKAIYNIGKKICDFDCRYASDKIYINILPLLVKDQ